MAIRVHFQSTGMVPGNGQPVTMAGDGLTIGRGGDNDMVLPDPDKAISKRHCAIELDNGTVTAIDLSMNGTFLNYGKMPIGDVPVSLNDGDVLTIGAYELLVEISEAAAAADAVSMPEPAAPVETGSAMLDSPDGDIDFLDDLLGAGAPLTGPASVRRTDDFDENDLLLPSGDDMDRLLDPGPPVDPGQSSFALDHTSAAQDPVRSSNVSVTVIPEDWDDLLGIDPPDEAFAQGGSAVPDGGHDALAARGKDPAQPAPETGRQTRPPASAAGTLPPGPSVSAASHDAARAFLRTAGAEGLTISDEELLPTLSRMGHVMRILIRGMREILMTRTSMKSEFRIQQTVIGAGGNNPLKFSISPEQAVEVMIKPSSPGYLDATDAAEQALRDIKAHEIAMMTGMEAALKDVLRQLSPEALEKQLQDGGGISGLLKGRKARYWEVYEKMYAEISDRAENEFHEMFSREFARAYQAQLERLK